MVPDQILALGASTPLVATDAEARAQWERVLALRERAGKRVWPAHRIQSWQQWLEATWNRARDSATVAGYVIGADQTEWLWQHIIDESDSAASLIESRGIAATARRARRNLLEAGLDPGILGGPLWRRDGAEFLEWNRAFEARLAERRWIDPDSLAFRLNRVAARDVGQDIVVLDPGPLTSTRARLLTQWRDAGFSVDIAVPEPRHAQVSAIRTPDPASELAAAADWAEKRLGSSPDGTLAIVVPDLAARIDDVETRFVDRFGADRVSCSVGRPIDRIGVFAAAINALEMLGDDARFEVVSRWLRSPFFAADDEAAGRASIAERRLRDDFRSDLNFSESWRRNDLRGWFIEHLPDRVAAIDTVLARLPESATPTGWTAAWQDCLRTLGWSGFDIELPLGQQHVWENAWSRFSGLTPVTGRIGRNAALAGLRRLMRSESTFSPTPLSGVSLLSKIDEIGPGFDGAWVTGLADSALPLPVRPNPLIPWSLQVEHGMPGADPAAELERARELLDRLGQRVPELWLSCPKRIDDRPCAPSSLVEDWPDGSVTALGMSRIAARIGAREWQSGPSVAPPHEARLIPGGTRTLDLQAACPAKAFCIARLGAEPLEPPTRGIDPRLRGVLIHRVLERLLDPDAAGEARDRLEDCLNRTLARLARPGDAFWQAQIDAERTRIGALLETFLDAERERPSFETIAVERRTEILIGDFALNGRIDRIDRIGSGAVVLLDYKSGLAPERWFEPRLGSCQLPLYLQAADASAIATIRLDPTATEYAGAGLEGTQLPGRFRIFDETGWQQQLTLWRASLGTLVDEFTSGDVRVPVDAGDFVASDSREHAGGAFAPLTRVGELK